MFLSPIFLSVLPSTAVDPRTASRMRFSTEQLIREMSDRRSAAQKRCERNAQHARHGNLCVVRKFEPVAMHIDANYERRRAQSVKSCEIRGYAFSVEVTRGALLATSQRE